MYMYMYISLYKEFKLVCKNILSNVESIANKLEQEKQTKVKTKENQYKCVSLELQWYRYSPVYTWSGQFSNTFDMGERYV